MARLFNLQTINQTADNVQSGAKESYRALTNIALKPFLIHIANNLSHSLLTSLDLERGLRFCYETQVLSSQDFREQSTYLKGLKESGVISTNEARAWLNLSPMPDKEMDRPCDQKVNIAKIQKEKDKEAMNA